MGTNTLKLKVAERVEEPGNILRLRLVEASGAVLPAFEAGAHLDLHLEDGSTDLWRQYSLCSDPATSDAYEIGVLLDPKSRGGSVAVHKLAQMRMLFQIVAIVNGIGVPMSGELLFQEIAACVDKLLAVNICRSRQQQVHEIPRLARLHQSADDLSLRRQLLVIAGGDLTPLAAVQIAPAPTGALLNTRRRRKRDLRPPALHGVERCGQSFRA